MTSFLKCFLHNVDDQGQTVVEYILVFVLIAFVLIVAFRRANVGEAVGSQAERIQNQMVSP